MCFYQHNSKTNDPEVLKLGVQGMTLVYTRSDIVLGLKGYDLSNSSSRSLTGSVTLHNDTSFHSHSLDGDTDKSNMACV